MKYLKINKRKFSVKSEIDYYGTMMVNEINIDHGNLFTNNLIMNNTEVKAEADAASSYTVNECISLPGNIL